MSDVMSIPPPLPMHMNYLFVALVVFMDSAIMHIIENETVIVMTTLTVTTTLNSCRQPILKILLPPVALPHQT